MKRIRVQAIIIRDNKALFAYGKTSTKGLRHSFIGGRLESGETAEEGVLRELYEEACVDGNIEFKIDDPRCNDHITYLVDIGDQEPKLGENPEEKDTPKEQRHLQKVIWFKLSDIESFTDVDKDFFRMLLIECKKQKYKPVWLGLIDKLISTI